MAHRSKGSYWLALMLLVVALAFYARHHDLKGLFSSYTYSEQEVQNLEERLESLQAEKIALEHNVEGLDKDRLTQEAAVRSSTGRVREDETIYKVEIPEESAGSKIRN